MAVELTLFRSNFNAYRSDVAEYVNNFKIITFIRQWGNTLALI